MFTLLFKYCQCYEINEDNMGGACGMDDRKFKCIQGFVGNV
jgi:hypothetical protein